jgi:hypothetical protein
MWHCLIDSSCCTARTLSIHCTALLSLLFSKLLCYSVLKLLLTPLLLLLLLPDTAQHCTVHQTVAAAVGMRTEGGGILSSMAAIDVLLMAVYFAVLAAAHKSVDLQRMFRPSHKQEAPEMPNKVCVCCLHCSCCVVVVLCVAYIVCTPR